MAFQIKKSHPKHRHLSRLLGLRLNERMIAKVVDHCFDALLQGLICEFTALTTLFPGGIKRHGKSIGVVELAIIVDRYGNQ